MGISVALACFIYSLLLCRHQSTFILLFFAFCLLATPSAALFCMLEVQERFFFIYLVRKNLLLPSFQPRLTHSFIFKIPFVQVKIISSCVPSLRDLLFHRSKPVLYLKVLGHIGISVTINIVCSLQDLLIHPQFGGMFLLFFTPIVWPFMSYNQTFSGIHN